MKKYKKKICIVSSTRADFGILSNLIKILQKQNFLKTCLIVTGTHLEKKYGLTYKEISKKKIKIYKKIKVLPNKNDQINLLKNSSLIIKKFSKELKTLSPNLILLLGDRYETFCIAYCAFILGIPIAHFYGGEVTKNSLDDSLRHSITKLSNFHFVSTKHYYRRVAQLGEEKKNIYNIGSLSLDKINKIKFLSKKQLQKKLKINFNKHIILCTIHAETNNFSQIQKQIIICLKALNEIKDSTIIFTMPNNDLGSDLIIKKISNFCRVKKSAYFFKSLGRDIYFSCVKLSSLVIGNSSSGIIETPTLSTPSINLGDRQRGRVKAICVHDVEFKKKKIVKKINDLLKREKKNLFNPYYKLNSLKKTLSILKKLDLKNITQKQFIDL